MLTMISAVAATIAICTWAIFFLNKSPLVFFGIGMGFPIVVFVALVLFGVIPIL